MKTTKLTFSLLILLLLSTHLFSSNPSFKWLKSIGGGYDDNIQSVLSDNNGNFIVVGYFKSSTLNLGNSNSINNYYSGSAHFFCRKI